MDQIGLILTSSLDIFITTFIIYLVIKLLIKTEKMLFILNAFILFFIIYFTASFLKLNTVLFLLNSVTTWIVVIIFILFQKEIRDSLEKIGSITSLLGNTITVEEDEFIDELYDSVKELADSKTGALITIQGDVSLGDYASKAVNINADYSKELIGTIFNKNSILHDGAVIVSDTKIICASAYYPISLDLNMDKIFGTRHRAAMTISKETDAITVVVSEERGEISIAYRGKIYQTISEEFFKEFIKEKYIKE